MFGLFSKSKRKEDPFFLTEEVKKWVDSYFVWLINCYGLESLKRNTPLLPVAEDFPFKVEKTNDISGVLKCICSRFEIDYNEVVVRILDTENRKWEIIQSESKRHPVPDSAYEIHINKGILQDLSQLVLHLSIEVCAIKLSTEYVIRCDQKDAEIAYEFAAVFFGYGVFNLNCDMTNPALWMRKTSFIMQPAVVYFMALQSHFSGSDIPNLAKFLSDENYQLYIRAQSFISDKTLSAELYDLFYKAEENSKLLLAYKEAVRTRDYDKALKVFENDLKDCPDSVIHYNNLGYMKLLQGKFQEAIGFFDKGIEIDPYAQFLCNNRGYCHLLSGNLEQAKLDLDFSFDIESDNSFTHRNLGLYCLKTGEFDKALKYFCETERLDNRTELMQYCFGLYYSLTGDKTKAQHYFVLSERIDEHEGKKELKEFFSNELSA